MNSLPKLINSIFIDDSVAYLGMTSNLGQVTLSYVLYICLKGLYVKEALPKLLDIGLFFGIYSIFIFINYVWIIGTSKKFNIGYGIGTAIVILSFIVYYLTTTYFGVTFFPKN